MFKDWLKNKSEMLFMSAGLVLAAVVLGVLIYSLSFLSRAVNAVATAGLIKPEEIATFNLADLKKVEALR